MKKYLPIFIIFLLVSCSVKPTIHLKSDGSIFLNGNRIGIEDLGNKIKSSEVSIHMDPDVTYKRLSDVMTKLEESGVKEATLSVNFITDD